jgi:hypothetical protein
MGAGIIKHGEPIKYENWSMFRIAIRLAIINTILYYGGFWNPILHSNPY